MILVDVYVPVLDRIYDFYLDSGKPVEDVIREINMLITEKEKAVLCGSCTEFLLFDARNRIALKHKYSLSEQGVGEGAQLLLV